MALVVSSEVKIMKDFVANSRNLQLLRDACGNLRRAYKIWNINLQDYIKVSKEGSVLCPQSQIQYDMRQNGDTEVLACPSV